MYEYVNQWGDIVTLQHELHEYNAHRVVSPSSG